MNAIMLSNNPKSAELIANGLRKYDIRKTRPKIDTPFKAYIYVTKPKEKWVSGNLVIYRDDLWLTNGKVQRDHECKPKAEGAKRKRLNGTVIGEFICDKIYEIEFCGDRYLVNKDVPLTNEIANESCLEYIDLWKYLGIKKGYALHISELKIYRKPRELSRFKVKSKSDLGKRASITPLRHAPRSWCYVVDQR